MVGITDPDLNQVVENFEDMVKSIERYRATLVSRRKSHAAEGRDPETYDRVYGMNIKRIESLHEELEGEVYDRLKAVLDGTGTLASANEGRWI